MLHTCQFRPQVAQVAGPGVQRLLPADLNSKVREQIEQGLLNPAAVAAAAAKPTSLPRTASGPAARAQPAPAAAPPAAAARPAPAPAPQQVQQGPAAPAGQPASLPVPDEDADPAVYEAEVKAREARLGPSHPDVAEAICNLAILHNQVGGRGADWLGAVLPQLCDAVRCSVCLQLAPRNCKVAAWWAAVRCTPGSSIGKSRTQQALLRLTLPRGPSHSACRAARRHVGGAAAVRARSGHLGGGGRAALAGCGAHADRHCRHPPGGGEDRPLCLDCGSFCCALLWCGLLSACIVRRCSHPHGSGERSVGARLVVLPCCTAADCCLQLCRF